MLSICIPVYNYTIDLLVNALSIQIKSVHPDCEIIVIDDASNDLLTKERNRNVATNTGIKYIELNQNIGRAAIRNSFLKYAQNDYLLFLDCDSGIPSDNFLDYYYRETGKKQVVCGGRIYPPEPPTSEYKLHWEYGRRQESKPVDIRNADPYKSFMTHNFMIHKDILKKIRFDENILTYGHEDTVYGCELKLEGIPIQHINNPVIHQQLESSIVFIQKTKSSIRNLIYITNQYHFKEVLIEDVRLLKTFNKIKRMNMTKPMSFAYKILNPLILGQLCSSRPSLNVFAMFKLGYLCYITQNKLYSDKFTMLEESE